MVSLRTLLIACLITALVGAGGGMLGASLLGASSGPAGAQGPAGEPGADGADGADGVNGSNGADGADGAPGAAGRDGAAGPSGPAGARGATGAPGVAGPAGAPGAPGQAGATGPQGEVGPQGEAGPQGPAGLVDYGYFTVSSQFVPPNTGVALPIAQTSGALDSGLTVDPFGGGTLNLEPGVYRFSSLVRYLSVDNASPVALRLTTFYQGASDIPTEPLDNISLSQFTPFAANVFQFASTDLTIQLEYSTSVRLEFIALGSVGGVQVSRGWLMVERLG